ncbi:MULTISPECIES: protein adenylyltransferase SelO [unclassified Halomonas]|uniref:protein adenylyltransferase SelO n=1 Tax=unclassified Halomonas TaxID=2609666 RepID=UPI0020769104|nr:YdiU family protein [Halomonas sp. S3-1-8]
MLTYEHDYTRLPEPLWLACEPSGVRAPKLIAFNEALARKLGASDVPDDETLAQWFSGNEIPNGAKPVALGYAGHQFGNFVPQLGDGRALLLGDVVDAEGRRFDVQLKGSGRTPFSRGGDGRSPLGPVLREYLVSEFMAAVGVPTTRALAGVASGERVARQMPEPGAVFTRVASSHVRVGTFQFAARHGEETTRALADYIIARHYPEAREQDDPYLALLECVTRRQAELVARWMSLGFIHGVMNTDNTSISGETIDYGPCAFMEQFDPRKVFSSIDEGGRYAFNNQPAVAQWNLARFAETLLPLMNVQGEEGVELAVEVIRGFEAHFDKTRQALRIAKLGLAEDAGDTADTLMDALETLMHQGRMDMTATFDALNHYAEGFDDARREALLALTHQSEAFDAWLEQWRAAPLLKNDTRFDAMRRANPVVIPRNHRVKEVIDAAMEGDFSPFHTLLSVVSAPFDESVEARRLAAPATDSQAVLRTFCGT